MVKYSIIGLLLFCFVTISTSSFVVAEQISPSEAAKIAATGSKEKVVDECTVRTSITQDELESVLGTGATVTIQSGSKVSSVSSGTVLQNSRDVCVFSLVKLAGRWLSIVAGTLASIFIILAGILFMRSGEDKEKVGKAKALLLSSIVGFLIAALGTTLLRLIANLLTS